MSQTTNYHQLLPLYKFIETLIFSEGSMPTKDTQPVKKAPKEVYKPPAPDFMHTQEFVSKFRGLIGAHALWKLLNGKGAHLVEERGANGRKLFDPIKLIEFLERTCKDPLVKSVAQNYLDEYYQCD